MLWQLRAGEAIRAKGILYPLSDSMGQRHLRNMKPTDCNNSLSPTAPQSQTSRQQRRPPLGRNQTHAWQEMFTELDFDTSGAQPQEKVTTTVLDINLRYVFMGGRRLILRLQWVNCADRYTHLWRANWNHWTGLSSDYSTYTTDGLLSSHVPKVDLCPVQDAIL